MVASPESILFIELLGPAHLAPVMAEGGLFYAGMFTVVAGLGVILGMGVWSYFHPYRGDNFVIIDSYVATLTMQ